MDFFLCLNYFRAVKQEMLALSQMAEQINSKFNHNKEDNSQINGSYQSSSNQSSESVDLDNLFAFLSEVTPNSNVNALIDEIGEKMDNLVEDLDVELETVIQQEMEGLALERPEKLSPLPPPPQMPPPGIPAPPQLSSGAKGMGVPSLPEPTMPPPPPPLTNGPAPPAPAHVPKITGILRNRGSEPIYEALIAREELPTVPELPEPPTNFAESTNHKLRPKSPAIATVRSASPVQRSSGGPLSPSSPKHSRPSSRASSTGGSGHPHAEREQRRKYRVEKKLQEMHQMDATERERDALRDDIYYDILEFAESNFNTHERSPEGTIMATLTRKGRGKGTEAVVPKYEMITYYRGTSIPTSHIHMYDPENVSVACTIFRDLCKYTRGELNTERELQVNLQK